MVDTDNTRQTMEVRRRTTPRVWHELPTGELKMKLQSMFFLKIPSLKYYETTEQSELNRHI